MKMRVLLSLLLLAAVISLGSAQNCGLITMASELGSVDMPSNQGIIADALNLGGDNPENPRIQIMDFQVTCAVADTEPETFQFLSVVVALSCVDEQGSPLCGASELGGEGNFTAQFELQCIPTGEWVLGDDASATLADAFTNPANGTLTTPTDEQCGVCYSNVQAAARLPVTVSYDSINHCASCDSSCLNVGLGLCTTLGAADCCSFYHDAGSGFMCVDMCPLGFSPNATFFCQIADCGPLTIDDGTVTYNQATAGRGDTEFEAEAIYECNELFALNGNANRTCQANSDWSGTDPTCEACSENCLECFYNDSSMTTVCTACTVGFVTENGVCIADCGPLTIGNGTVTYNQSTAGRGDTELGAVAIYECNELFALNGNAIRTCQANSDWSGTDPTCEACSENCLECFYSDSSMTTVCTACTVGFVTENGVCIADCGPLTIGNGTVTYNQTTAGRGDTELGAVANYECNELFTLNGNAIRTCLANSNWNGTDPMCVVSCITRENPENGEVFISDIPPVFGSVAIYSCNDDFLISGTRRQTCQASGNWSSVEPTCVEDTNPNETGGLGGIEIALIVCAILLFLLLVVVLLSLLLCGTYFKSKD